MSKPLKLFIAPPYNGISLVHSYGQGQNQIQNINIFHNTIALLTSGSGALRATSDGLLSICSPGTNVVDPREEIVLSDNQVLPESVTLYLHIDPIVRVFPSLSQGQQAIWNSVTLVGFAFLNVETSSLGNILSVPLQKSILPKSLNANDKLNVFLSGGTNLIIKSGDTIGIAAKDTTDNTKRMLEFAVLTKDGTIDPAFFYHHMSDFVNENTQDLQNFLGIVPEQWPILDSSLTDLQIIERTRTGLFSMSVLNTVKNRQAISAQQWREIGNNQKSLYRNQLLKRTGHASNAITDPPFEFDDLDFKNIFQLEAITEFYANYTDPWRGGEQVEGENLPREQLLSDGSLNPNYVKIDFLSPKGSSATGNGNIITLDLYDSTILDRVSPDSSNGDIIYFENDTNQSRPSHQYRIVSINKATQTVILDASPSFLNGTSSWEISLRPVLVIIDSFGGRISGSKATQNNPSNLQQLFLDGLPNPSKINPKFDTIYLYSDTGRPSKTYRIQSIDNSAHVITVDTAPQLNGAESFWNLQAGLSGVLPGTEGNLMSLENDGYDHYDACLFVVWDGQIQERYRWTSYTSHAGTGEALSSIRGNKKYSFYSEKAATKDFINYAFLLENTNSSAFYFEDPPRNDPNGKTGVMIHKGTNNATSAHRGTGSAGCLVSPSFEQCRDRMILFYQDEQRAITQANDSQVQLIYGLTSQIFTADKTAKKPIFQAIAWRNKIKGAIWVIRPEEIPV